MNFDIGAAKYRHASIAFLASDIARRIEVSKLASFKEDLDQIVKMVGAKRLSEWNDSGYYYYSYSGYDYYTDFFNFNEPDSFRKNLEKMEATVGNLRERLSKSQDLISLQENLAECLGVLSVFYTVGRETAEAVDVARERRNLHEAILLKAPQNRSRVAAFAESIVTLSLLEYNAGMPTRALQTLADFPAAADVSAQTGRGVCARVAAERDAMIALINFGLPDGDRRKADILLLRCRDELQREAKTEGGYVIYQPDEKLKRIIEMADNVRSRVLPASAR